MNTKRRMLVVLSAAALIGLPAGILRAACVGAACEEEISGPRIPFCSLPHEMRSAVVAGSYEGRSPDLTVVTRSARVRTRGGTWPVLRPMADGRVPVVFGGAGIGVNAAPAEVGLDDIAPTLAEAISLHRPHPEVRSGEAIESLIEPEATRLILLVVWTGIGSADLEAEPDSWPTLQGLMDANAGTMDGSAGSLPLDPAATFTTIGTGGLPHQHGITGTDLRWGRDVVRAWSDPDEPSVIATLANDLDDANDQRPSIGLAASDPAHQGLIGGDWYVDNDRDQVDISRDPAAAAMEMLERGFGTGDETDLLAVALTGTISEMDAATGPLLEAATSAAGGNMTFAVAGSGSTGSAGGSMSAAELIDALDAELGASVVKRVASAGLFLDQRALVREDLTDDDVLEALVKIDAPDGTRLVADAFSDIAISLARYC